MPYVICNIAYYIWHIASHSSCGECAPLSAMVWQLQRTQMAEAGRMRVLSLRLSG
jgi:hypothetical protein